METDTVAPQDAQILLEIFNNILKNPKQNKYRNLNQTRLRQRLTNYDKSLKVLGDAGFYESEDGKQLLFDEINLQKLQEISETLSSTENKQEKKNSQDETKYDTSKRDKAENLLKSLNTETTSIDSSHLLQAANNKQEKRGGFRGFGGFGGLGGIGGIMGNQRMLSTECNNLDDCESLQQIINVLSQKMKTKRNPDVIIRAFHHLLETHNNEFEQIHDKLVSKCNNNKLCSLKDCSMRRRNFRDRNSLNNKAEEIAKLYLTGEIEEIAEQQIIDSIHCYFYHTFDSGYRLKRSKIIEIQQRFESEQKEQKETDERDIVTAQISEYIRDLTKNQNDARDKFVTAPQNDEKIDSNQHGIMYSFGYRFFYWDFYKESTDEIDPIVDKSLNKLGSDFGYNPVATKPIANVGYKLKDWYIPPIFTNLKEELINNNICNIGKKQWDIQCAKASHYASCDRARFLKLALDIMDVSSTMDNPYGLMYRGPVSKMHITAMLMYCNNDSLQFSFSKTFRKLSSKESDESLKKRHMNYHHFGRLLRELTSGYGTPTHCVSDKSSFFHGITMGCHFKSIITAINGPFSTSLDYCVAVSFSQKGDRGGMVLELKLDNNDCSWSISYNSDAIACFDCQWLSDFTNEREVFFTGGHSYLHIQTIIETSAGKNYFKYLQAMSAITYNVGEIGVTPTVKNYDELLMIQYRLLLHCLHILYPLNNNYKAVKSLPKYIEMLLFNHLASIIYFKYEYHKDHTDIHESEKIYQLLFSDDDGCLKWDVICKLFSGIRHVKLRIFDKTLNNPLIFSSIISFLKKNQQNKELQLRKIELTHYISAKNMDLEAIVSTYLKQFEEVKWKIKIVHDSIVNITETKIQMIRQFN
eukprot:519285_1